jgi:hypothetical protein
MGTLSVGAAGARGDEEAPPIERMSGIVNGYDLQIVIE